MTKKRITIVFLGRENNEEEIVLEGSGIGYMPLSGALKAWKGSETYIIPYSRLVRFHMTT
jgi:hypothetical protein